LIHSRQELNAEAQFGAWRLTPDWLKVADDGSLQPAPQFPKRFGLDAVRVPLYLKWGGFDLHPAVANARNFWSLFTGDGAWPDWVLLDETIVHLRDAMPGVESISVLVEAPGAEAFSPFPALDWRRAEYYQATLLLIAELARAESAKQ